MDPNSNGYYRSQRNQQPRQDYSEKVYPFRHCLMGIGGVLIVMDLGLFIGCISIIAVGMDMSTYGFAAMIACTVLTMVFACTALVCGCRAKRPRSDAYEIKQQRHSMRMAASPGSPKKQISFAPVPPHMQSTGPPARGVFMPVSTAQAQAKTIGAPPVIRVQYQRPTAEIRDRVPSVSDCSRNATYGGSVVSEVNQQQVRFQIRPTRQMQRHTNI